MLVLIGALIIVAGARSSPDGSLDATLGIVAIAPLVRCGYNELARVLFLFSMFVPSLARRCQARH
jgi:hypothetical protein